MRTGKHSEDKQEIAKDQYLRHLNFGYAKHISVKKEIDDDIIQMVRRFNITEEVARQYCDCVDFDCMSYLFHGICMENLNGGLEIFSDKYCQGPITLGTNGITFIKGHSTKKDKNSHLILFADCLDFLAYLSLRDKFFKGIPESCDVLILNEVTNLMEMLDRLGDYEHIYLLLPLSVAGRTLAKTIETLHKFSARNCSNIYSCFPRLVDFARHKDTLLNKSKIIL